MCALIVRYEKSQSYVYLEALIVYPSVPGTVSKEAALARQQNAAGVAVLACKSILSTACSA